MSSGSSEGTRRSGSSQIVHYAKTRIRVTGGPDVGLERHFAGRQMRIGTSPENEVALSDETVSRFHCEIDQTLEGLRVRDCGSTNGTFVGGVRIFDALVTGPVTLHVGDSTLAITPLDEIVEREQVPADRFGDVLGRSGRMRELFADLERIAASLHPVLIEGETGTGKDVIAESIHRMSKRADGPYVVFDCGAVAPSLAESELFGHERGAFTGAVAARPGVFEQAHGGTLFLDEVGELATELQPKLLRALENGEVRRIGSTRTTPFDVRVLAATNRNLESEVRQGNFREDLFFRLAALHVLVPPLRDRVEDLPLLVEHFLGMEDPPRSIEDVSSQTWTMLEAHSWPGNVRELRNVVRRLCVTPERAFRGKAREERPDPSQPAAPAARPSLPLRIARREAIASFESSYVEGVLEEAQGNVTRAATIAEVSRQLLTRLIRKYGLRMRSPESSS
jgi:transcriptional regulator with GAF, ATPase, and Fis domain